MNKLKWLIALNVTLLLSVLFQVVTGVILFFDMFASKIELVSRLHGYNGFVLAGLISLHLIFNWSWIKANFLRRRAVSVK